MGVKPIEQVSGGDLPASLGVATRGPVTSGGTVPPPREATAADRAGVVALWQACGLTRPWNDPQRDFDLAAGGEASAVLIVGDGAVVGSIMVGFDGHRGWVYYLAVDPNHRRYGLGRALMEAAEVWLAARGCPKVQLMVRDGNDEVAAFYAALGFERQRVATFGRFLQDGGR
jgi:ribosomal protein S18 acetylase RimI-like enzyme